MIKTIRRVIALSSALLAFACQTNVTLPLIEKSAFDSVIDGKEVSLYTLSSKSGITMQVTNYGAKVVSLFTPDRSGNWEDIVLGFESIDRYLNNKGERFIGSTIGRYGNRIAAGKFELNGECYQLSTYNNGQCLHGGDNGFDKVVWSVEEVTSSSILLSYVSPDMEEGFPGELSVKMLYEITPEGGFKVAYDATTTKDTPVNLTHHSFFNLKGEGNGTINDHQLCIAADRYTPINEVSIPLGTVDFVDGTPFDFRVAKEIQRDLSADNEQLRCGSGYDHNWVLNRKSDDELEFAASVLEPTSGRYMEVWTTEPALQFYGGNFFDGGIYGKTGKSFNYRESFALETQHYPDSPNQPSFPSTILRPGENYHHVCIYKFSVK